MSAVIIFCGICVKEYFGQIKMYAQNNNKQSEKCLWVKGGHGLGYRLLSLETACRYAYKHNLSVYIDCNDPIYEQSHSEVLTFLGLQSINSTLKPKIELYNNLYPRDQRLFTEPDLTKLITTHLCDGEPENQPHVDPALPISIDLREFKILAAR